MNDTENSEVVCFEGAVCMGEAHAVLAKLKAAQSATKDVWLDVRNVEAADLTFVQLVEAARRSAREVGCSVRLNAPASDALAVVLRRGGFLEGAESKRFWLAESEVAQ